MAGAEKAYIFDQAVSTHWWFGTWTPPIYPDSLGQLTVVTGVIKMSQQIKQFSNPTPEIHHWKIILFN
jgi:hypothetical protein